MYSDLPAHLQTLNALPSSSSPPSSSAINAEQEEQFWSFLNTDELFSNFGLAPQAFESKQAQTERKPVETPEAAPAVVEETVEAKPASGTATTLESFLATFAGETAIPSSYLSALASPLASTSAVRPTDVLPSAPVSTPADTPADDDDSPRVTGAKRLKMIGAPPAEIEEDKRRRNTEASARFRAKKKEREQALENRASESTNASFSTRFFFSMLTTPFQRSSRPRSPPSPLRRPRWRRRTTSSSLSLSTARATATPTPPPLPPPTACKLPSLPSARGNSVTSKGNQSK